MRQAYEVPLIHQSADKEKALKPATKDSQFVVLGLAPADYGVR